MNLTNLVSRIITGVIFVSVILGSIFYNKYSYFVVFLVIQILALREFYSLIENHVKVKTNRILNILGGIVLYSGSFLFFSGLSTTLAVITPFIIYILALFVMELYLKHPNPLQSLSYALLGQLYISLPFALLHYIVFYQTTDTSHINFIFILSMLIFIWVNDSFAYLFGVFLGKHKLFERISPKKSWEGFIGGACSAIVASVIYANYFPSLSVAEWIGVAIITVAFGTFGDLTESLFKRTLQVKDSGNILPGHGGILDRFDSMIFVIPALFVYLELLNFFKS